MKTQATNYRAWSKGMLPLLFAVSFCVCAEEAPPLLPLKHNPFAVPALINEPTPAQSTATAPKDMSIRAVLISETGTLININGSILGLHEFVDGYELISLDREKAVLSQDGNELVLTLPNTSDTFGLDPQQQ